MRLGTGSLAVRTRLVTGLILLTYLTTHYLNHALGLVSLDTMDEGRLWFLALWRNPVGTVALYGALLTHFSLALWSIYRRRTLTMPPWEALQLLLGLCIPPLLISHIVGNRIAHDALGTIDVYTRLVLILWEQRPDLGLKQAVLLCLAWTHGCMGLHFWLRFRPWYPRAAPVLLSTAVLLPVLALLGFAEAGREVSALARQPGWVASVMEAVSHPDASGQAWLRDVTDACLVFFAACVAGALVARGARRLALGRRGRVRIAYPGAREVTVPAGFTVLEASRLAGIPHVSVCGGRGRCSTCRVRVGAGREWLPAPSAAEQRVLDRVRAPADVRLACQLRPVRAVAVTPVLAAGPARAPAPAAKPRRAGQELEIAVLFADLRGFTRMAEHRLPYDVVFFLNRYFDAMGSAIDRAGGVANQFTGDGVMALFGVDSGPEAGSRQALIAAGAMEEALAELSAQLSAELPEPLRLGVGIHTGPTVVGDMGHGEGLYLTAVGDTVHVAARLEQLTKQYECELVISEDVARRAGLDASGYPRHELTLRNRTAPLDVRIIARAGDVAAVMRRREAAV